MYFVSLWVQVDKLDGDASINIRKGKTLLVFDLDVSCKWEGELKAAGKKVAFAYNLY